MQGRLWVAADLHVVSQMSENPKVLFSQLPLIKMNMAQESKCSAWNVAGFSIDCQQLLEHFREVKKQEKKIRKRRKPKTTGQAQGKARAEHNSLQRAPLKSCKSEKNSV